MTVTPRWRIEWPEDYRPKRRFEEPEEKSVLVVYEFDEKAHPRIPGGHEGGGRFRTKAQIAAILRAAAKGGGSPPERKKTAKPRGGANPSLSPDEPAALTPEKKKRLRSALETLRDLKETADLKEERARWRAAAAEGTVITEADDFRLMVERGIHHDAYPDAQEFAKGLAEEASYVFGESWFGHMVSAAEGFKHLIHEVGIEGLGAPGPLPLMQADIRFVGDEEVMEAANAVYWGRLKSGATKTRDPATMLQLALKKLVEPKDPDPGAFESIDKDRLKRDLKRLGVPKAQMEKIEALSLIESRHERQMRSEHCKEVLGVAPDTVALFKSPETGKWDPERVKLHDQIIDTLLRARDEKGDPDPKGEYLKPAPGPDGKPSVLLTAGGNAVGKGTVLKFDENQDAKPKDAVLIDFDEVKKFLPEFKYLSEKKDPYATDASHFESAHIAKRLQEEAKKKGLNLIIDASGNSSTHGYERQIEKLSKSGYHVKVIMVDAPFPTALEGMLARGEATGRYIPLPIMWRVHRNVVAHHLEWRENPAIEDFKVYYRHGAGVAPEDYKLISEGGSDQLLKSGNRYLVHDEGLFKKMTEKALHGATEPDIGHRD